MTDRAKFTCGHEAPIPAAMGRGEARRKRLAAYFGRPCYACAVRRLEERISRTYLDGTPVPDDLRQAAIDRRAEKLAQQYVGDSR